MLKLLKILLVSLLFIINSTNAFDINKWENYRNELLNLSNWSIYIKKIDNIIERNKGNINKLELLFSQLNVISKKIDNLKNSQNKNNLSIIINYFLYKTNISINLLNDLNEVSNNIDKDIDESLEEVKKISYVKSDLYDWFTDVYNDKTKTILAWKESYVYNWSVVAGIEEIDVKEIIFKIETSDTSNIKRSIQEASLYVEWRKLETVNANSIKIVSSTEAELIIKDIRGFYIPKEQIEYRLSIIPQLIWFEKVWEFQPLINLTEVNFSHVEWLISNKRISPIIFDDVKWIESFQISPSFISSNVVNSLNNSYFPRINISSIFDKNTRQNNWELKSSLDKLIFYISESNWSWIYEIANSDDTSNRVLWNKVWNTLEFDMSLLNKNIISKGNGEDYTIYISNNNDITVFLELKRDGIIYSVDWVSWANNINAYLKNSVNLWSRSY